MIYDKRHKVTEIRSDGGGLFISNYHNTYYFLTHVEGFESTYLGESRARISKEVLEKEFEVVENFISAPYSTEEKRIIPHNTTYKLKGARAFIQTVIGMEDDGPVELDVKSNHKYKKVIYVYYHSTEPDAFQTVEKINSLLEFEYEAPSMISLVVKTNKGFKFIPHKIKPLDINVNTMYNDDFKPVYEHIVDKLGESNKGIVLLHGEAGTGKTNLIKHLTNRIPKKRFVFVPPAMIGYLTDPSFIGELVENKDIILVLEDCEIYLKDRKEGTGNNNFVSTLLNLSDGVLSDILGIQIICTFNANIKTVDEALLRKGRLVADYEFKELSEDKANKLLGSLGVESFEGKRTLANIFNAKEGTYKTENSRTKVGFI